MSVTRPLEEILNRAESLLTTRVNEALTLSASAAERARSAGLAKEEALALRIHAHALKGLERHEEALEVYRHSRRLFVRNGNSVEAARTDIGRVDALMYLDRVPEARRAGRRALWELLELGETLRAGRLLSNLGNIEYRLDRPRVALEVYLEARSLLEASGGALDVAFVDYNLGNIRVQLGELDAAEHDYRTAQSAARKNRHPLLELHVEYALAGLDASRGRLAGALGRLAVCETRFSDMGHERGRCNALLDRAEVYRQLHMEPDAEHAARQAGQGFRRLGLRLDEARAMFHRGSAALHGGDLRRGRDILARAGTRFRELGNLVQAAAVTVRLAQAVDPRRSSPSTRARLIQELRSSRRTLSKSGFEILTRENRIEEARLALKEGRLRRVLTLLRKAEEDLDARLHPDLAARITHLRMQVASARRDRTLALAESETLVRHLERARQHLLHDEFLAAHLWKWRQFYGDWIRLRAADSSCAPRDLYRDLQQLDIRTVTGVSRSGRGSRLKADALSRAEDLRARLAALTAPDRRDLPTPSAPSIPRRLREARRLERELSEHLRRERLTHGRGLQRPEAAPEPLETLQSRLRPGDLWVHAFDEGAGVGFLVADREHAAAPGGRIDKKILDEALDDLRYQFDRFHLRTDFSERRASSLRAAALRSLSRLAEICLPAIDPFLPRTRRLLLFPAAGIERVPWGALPVAGNPLWQGRSVITVPNSRGLSTLAPRHRKRRDPGQEALLWAPDFPDLPHARQEVEDAAAALGRGKVVTGSAATRGAFLKQAGSARVLHFSGHGRFREDNPLYSSLEFSDGSLYFLDLERLSMRADLVVLSACRTGSARPGLQLGTGLARGFLHAGAQNLLLSQWPVGDLATSRFMGRFYRKLALGVAAEEALRQAALDGAAPGDHPAEWATFQLVGTSETPTPVV